MKVSGRDRNIQVKISGCVKVINFLLFIRCRVCFHAFGYRTKRTKASTEVTSGGSKYRGNTELAKETSGNRNGTKRLLTLLLTLCGLTSQKTNQGGLGLSRSAHEEAHPCFPNFVYAPLERIDARSINCPLIQLIPSDDYSVREKNTYSSPVYTEI